MNSALAIRDSPNHSLNHALTPSVPRELVPRFLWLPDRARNMGIHIMAGKGSGKSRLMGRMIAWLDFLRRIPLVIFDPHGPTIDNFLDKLIRLPKELQEPLWQRVFYVDMSGRYGRVVPFPLYYRFGGEGIYEISQRYLDVVRKLDPNLQSASIEGWNPLWRIGTSAGLILTAIGSQITEAEDLVRNSMAWRREFDRALQTNPEVQPAVDFFEEFSEWKEELRSRKSDSFLNKVSLFTFDPSMKAMFGADQAGIDWKRIISGKYAVLLDFRGEQDLERRRFKMVWAFNYFLSFIKDRGAGRHRPVSLIVDELTSLFASSTLTTDIFASELDELINVLARNYMVWLTLAHQELFQLDERAQNVLMAMGTQMLGVTSDRSAALALARQFFRYDAYRVKKYEPMYGSTFGMPTILDYRTVEFTMEEQAILNSYQFSDQGRFHFLVRTAAREGDITGALRPISLAHFDEDIYPNEELVAQAREILMERRGRPIREILSEIKARRTARQVLSVMSKPPSERIHTLPSPGFVTIKNDGRVPDDDDNNPEYFGEKKTAQNPHSRG